MAMREIRTDGDPVRRTPCDPITTIDDRVRSLVDDLLETVDTEGRAGLAATDPDYASLYEVFWRNGRWETVRHVAELGDVLRRARWEAQLLGRTLDFSVRFEPSRALPRTTGGITAATRYVPTDKYFRVEASTSTLLEYWSRRRRAAVWYYLTSVHKLPFGPPLPSQQRFASSLLDRLAGADLKAGFALYNLVHERLGARGYELPKVACRTELPEASWTPEGLPKEVLERLSAGTRGRAG